jgi:hypothetical protein
VDGDAVVFDDSEVPKAKPADAKQAPAKQAAKKGTLADAIVGALVGDADAERKRVQAVQEQQVRAQEAQYRPQFEQMLYVELALLRRSCKPDAKMFVDVAKAAKAGLHVPLRKYVLAMVSQRQGATPDEPRVAMQKLLMPLAEAKLGPEKTRLFRQECDKRAEARKRTTVANLVVALDERLVLTADQRAKLVEALSAKYDNSWGQYCEAGTDFSQCLPCVPEETIIPLLDAKQKIVWQKSAKLEGEQYDTGELIVDQSGDAVEIQEISRLVENVKDDR